MSDKWIKVEEQKPKGQLEVLVAYMNEYGVERTTTAQYVPPKSVRSEDFLDQDLEIEGVEEYDEKEDCFWVIEGWWECSEMAEINYVFSDEILYWMPKPEYPREGQ